MLKENTMKIASRLIAAGGLLIWAQAGLSQNLQAQLPMQRVSLSASASVQVPQDVLTLSLSTQRDGADAQTVQSQLKAALDTALTLARREARDGLMAVHTGRFSLSPRHDRNGKLTGWQGSAELVLQGSDFARLGEMAGKLQTLTVANASFSLTPEQRQTAQGQAQNQAIAQFRQRASEAAKSFGFSGYALVDANINAGDFGGPRPGMLAMSARAGGDDAPVPMEAGLTTVTVTVSGSVQLN